MNHERVTDSPQLSILLRTFSNDANHDWNVTLEMTRAMDAAGVDRVVVSDHLVFGENLDAYADPSIGGQEGGSQPTGPDGNWLEPVVFLTAVAATTTRIRLGTAVLLAALRRPAVLAKQFATMDVLSGGRVDVGVGVGWQREEYDAVGLPFEDRGRLLDHTLEVCQAAVDPTARRVLVAGTDLQRHPPDAETPAARRHSGVDQRHGEQAGGSSAQHIRHAVDSVGTGDREPRGVGACDETGDRRRRRRPEQSGSAGHRAA